jgi:hypothetical protein
MTCERVEPLISAYIDGEVTAAEREHVLSHIRVCPKCAALLAAYRQLRLQVRSLGPVEPPPALAGSVWDRIAAAPPRRSPWRGVARALGGGAVAAAAALLVLVVFTFSTGDGPAGERVARLLGPAAAVETPTPAPVVQRVEPASAATAEPPPTAPAVASLPVTPSPAPLPATATPAPPSPAEPAAPTAAPASATAPAPPPPPPATATPAPRTVATPAPLPPRTATPVSPAATRPPATATATRPPATPTPAATATPAPTVPPAPVAGASFSRIYERDADLRRRLGAPVQSEQAVEARAQPFEGGAMEWLAEGKLIYVLYRDSRAWARFADTWSPDEVTVPGDPPPPGRYRPQRAFGKVWREHPTVRERLGWATAPERADAARLQRFERGLMLKSAAAGVVYILFEDGAWQQAE